MTDANPGHIANANAHADSALATIVQVNVPTTPKELTGLRQATEAYRAGMVDALKSTTVSVGVVESQSAAARQRLDSLAKDITTQGERMTQLASEHQSQFSGAQDTRLREFGDAQTARQDRFSTAMTEYSQKLAEQDADFTKQKDAGLRQMNADITELKETYVEKAGAALRDVEEHRQRIEKLVGVIGNLGVTSGYLRAANHARISMWVWQVITVASLAGVSFVAYHAFLPLTLGSFTWEAFAGRVVLSLSVGVLAAYGAKQADKFHDSERRNRRLALELEAIGPYLAPLPQEQQDRFRLEIGDRSFGREEIRDSDSDKSPASLFDVVFGSKSFREFVTDLVRAAKQ